MGSKGKEKAVGIGVAIAIISALGAGYLYYSSYPEMDIMMYYSDQSLISKTNVKLTLYREDGDFDKNSNVCFQVRNAAENVAPNKVDATNFQVWIDTDAVCDNCNANTPFGAFPSQSEEKVCRSVKAPADKDEINFNVIPKFDALNLHWEPKTTFNCKLSETEEYVKNYICNIS